MICFSIAISAYTPNGVAFSKRPRLSLYYHYTPGHEHDGVIPKDESPRKFNVAQNIFDDKEVIDRKSEDPLFFSNETPSTPIHNNDNDDETNKRRQAWIAAKEVP